MPDLDDMQWSSVADRSNPNKTYLQYNRLIGQSGELGSIFCVDRDLNGTPAGPANPALMMNDIQVMLGFVFSALPEYGSIRITFEILSKEEYIVDNVMAETAENWRDKNAHGDSE